MNQSEVEKHPSSCECKPCVVAKQQFYRQWYIRLYSRSNCKGVPLDKQL